MTDNITARLLNDSWVNASNKGVRVQEMCREAAAEITRLEKAWQYAIDDCESQRMDNDKLIHSQRKADALAEAVRGYINGKCIDPEAMEAALTAYQENK